MRIAGLLVLALGGIAFTARGQTEQHPLPGIADASRGAALANRWCAPCHAPGGAVSDTIPSFRWIAGRSEREPGFIKAFLSHPHSPMPPLELDRAQIADLVAYFQSLDTR